MNVMIGDRSPQGIAHCGGHRRAEDELSSVKVRATRRQVDQLIDWAEPSRSAPGPSSPPEGLAICWPSNWWPEARRSSMCRPPWPRGSGCWPRGGPTRTTPTTPIRSPSPPCGLRTLRRRSGRSRRGAAAAGQAQQRHRRSNGPGWSVGSTRSLAELAPGGIAKELYVSDAERLSPRSSPQTPAQQIATTWPSSSSTTCADSTPRSRSHIAESVSPSGRRARR